MRYRGLMVLCLGAMVFVATAVATRYAVGQRVPATIYTDVCDPCDPAYKFIAPAPKDWTDTFGDSERTRLLHAISELRVVVASQGRAIMDLQGVDPNGATP